MCQQIPHRNPIFCILSPQVLDAIVRNGSPEQRERAMRTLSTDNTLRFLRTGSQPTPVLDREMWGIPGEAQRQRTIYDCQNTENLPGRVARAEGDDTTGDAAVDEAYGGLGATFDFYWEVYKRNSIDNNGLPLDAHVHFGRDYNNAFWDGQRMVFGDGDGELFNRFTASLDVIGHELAHGVTQHESRLVYFLQPGALNEHLSDAFGVMVKQYLLDQSVEEADWLIGAELLTDEVQGDALRSMKEPGTAYDDPVLGKDPQPAHMRDFVTTFEDNGGVHINSGIPNRAFYLSAVALGGYSWEKAGRIWNATSIDPRLKMNTGFRRFARLTVSNAANLYGSASQEERAVRDAWKEVGLEVS